MRKLLAGLLLIILIVSIIAVFFTYTQTTQEEIRLRNDIQYRSTLLAVSLRETVEPNFINKSESYLQNVVERYADKERIAGLSIIDNKGANIAVSSALPKNIQKAQVIADEVMDADKAAGEFVKFQDRKFFVFAIPLHDEASVVGSLMIV